MKYNDCKKIFVDKTNTYKDWQTEHKNSKISLEHRIVKV